ncbi:MAG: HlyD family secretion protein [Bacteroidales bacterium]
MEENNINIRSDEINEILGTPPRWIIRWGITVIFTVIAAIFVGCFFFKYPEVITAPVVITAENPPSVIVARVAGKPQVIFVEDGAVIHKGDTLGVMENPANFKHIIQLSKLLENFNINEEVDLEQYGNSNLILGEVQSNYSSFVNSLTSYVLFHKQKYHEQKIDALEAELKSYTEHLRLLNKQLKLSIRDYSITVKQFNRDSTLFADKVIAQVEFEKSQSTLLSKQQSIENARLTISNTEISVEQLKQSVAETKIDYETQRRKVSDDLVNAYNQLRSTLSSWEKSYLLVAPASGKLTYMGIWSNVQEVKSGESMFAITPDNIGEVQARMVIPFEGAGRVKLNQRVNIKLDGYPYIEFGMVEGILKSISSGYTDNGFPALAALPKGAVTSYGTALNLERELKGTAEISTDELTVFQRLFNNLKYLYKEKVD